MNTRRMMSCGTIMNDSVHNLNDEKIGKIEEMMIDLDSGQIEYAVLSFGGFLGVGDKLFAVPWKALSLDTEKKIFTLDVDKERLEDSPGFDKNDWPDFANQTFLDRVDRFYSGVGSFNRAA